MSDPNISQVILDEVRVVRSQMTAAGNQLAGARAEITNLNREQSDQWDAINETKGHLAEHRVDHSVRWGAAQYGSGAVCRRTDVGERVPLSPMKRRVFISSGDRRASAKITAT